MDSKKHRHFNYRVEDCIVCQMVGSSRRTKAPKKKTAKSGKTPKSAKSGGMSLKYFVGWIILHFSIEVQNWIFNCRCAACQKTFRDYLVAGPIQCQNCWKYFSPLVRAVLRTMKKDVNVLETAQGGD